VPVLLVSQVLGELLLELLAAFLIVFLIGFQVGQWAATLAILRYLSTLLEVLDRNTGDINPYKLPGEVVDSDKEE